MDPSAPESRPPRYCFQIHHQIPASSSKRNEQTSGAGNGTQAPNLSIRRRHGGWLPCVPG